MSSVGQEEVGGGAYPPAASPSPEDEGRKEEEEEEEGEEEGAPVSQRETHDEWNAWSHGKRRRNESPTL